MNTHWHTGAQLAETAPDKLAREVAELRERVKELEAAAAETPRRKPGRATREYATLGKPSEARQRFVKD